MSLYAFVRLIFDVLSCVRSNITRMFASSAEVNTIRQQYNEQKQKEDKEQKDKEKERDRDGKDEKENKTDSMTIPMPMETDTETHTDNKTVTNTAKTQENKENKENKGESKGEQEKKKQGNRKCLLVNLICLFDSLLLYCRRQCTLGDFVYCCAQRLCVFTDGKSKFLFATELFFLTHEALHVGLCSLSLSLVFVIALV